MIHDCESVLIACTLRSGSNLLCELLERGGFGSPTEYFQIDRYRNSVSARVLGNTAQLPTLTEHYQAFVAEQACASWRGTKWTWSQFECLMATAQMGSSTFDLHDWFPSPKWIFLRRKDLVAQAVSLIIAKKSNSWVAGDTAIANGPLEYDFEEIWTALCELMIEDQNWVRFSESIPPGSKLSVYYEDLARDAPGEMRRVLQFLDPSAPEGRDFSEIGFGLRNQSLNTALNEEISAQFRNDLQMGRHLLTRSDSRIERILDELAARASGDCFLQFVDLDCQRAVTISKIDIRRDIVVSGSHSIVVAGHFLDGVALRLDPGTTATIAAQGNRLLVEFLSHPWSGQCVIAHNSSCETLDLYGHITTSKPHLIDRIPGDVSPIVITAMGDRSPFAKGAETWIQRVWVRDY